MISTTHRQAGSRTASWPATIAPHHTATNQTTRSPHIRFLCVLHYVFLKLVGDLYFLRSKELAVFFPLHVCFQDLNAGGKLMRCQCALNLRKPTAREANEIELGIHSQSQTIFRLNDKRGGSTSPTLPFSSTSNNPRWAETKSFTSVATSMLASRLEQTAQCVSLCVVCTSFLCRIRDDLN